VTVDLRALDPTVIGGTGGSGTRAAALIVQTAGGYIGTNLNRHLDQVDLAAYHDRWINRWLRRPQESEEPMEQELAALLEDHLRDVDAPRAWGWKCPTSIYLLPFFDQKLPRFRFIHVVRDGRDMAFSPNQNQVRKHGDAFLGVAGPPGPRRSIRLWARVNEAAAGYGEANLGERYLRVRFEDLCQKPAAVASRILDFAGLEGDVERCVHEIEPPASLGRWRTQDPARIARLERAAKRALRRFGYLSSDRVLRDA
jgi:hypothetical protein